MVGRSAPSIRCHAGARASIQDYLYFVQGVSHLTVALSS